jgi:hypothetical protein
MAATIERFCIVSEFSIRFSELIFCHCGRSLLLFVGSLLVVVAIPWISAHENQEAAIMTLERDIQKQEKQL